MKTKRVSRIFLLVFTVLVVLAGPSPLWYRLLFYFGARGSMNWVIEYAPSVLGTVVESVGEDGYFTIQVDLFDPLSHSCDTLEVSQTVRNSDGRPGSLEPGATLLVFYEEEGDIEDRRLDHVWAILNESDNYGALNWILNNRPSILGTVVGPAEEAGYFILSVDPYDSIFQVNPTLVVSLDVRSPDGQPSSLEPGDVVRVYYHKPTLRFSNSRVEQVWAILNQPENYGSIEWITSHTPSVFGVVERVSENDFTLRLDPSSDYYNVYETLAVSLEIRSPDGRPGSLEPWNAVQVYFDPYSGVSGSGVGQGQISQVWAILMMEVDEATPAARGVVLE